MPPQGLTGRFGGWWHFFNPKLSWLAGNFLHHQNMLRSGLFLGTSWEGQGTSSSLHLFSFRWAFSILATFFVNFSRLTLLEVVGATGRGGCFVGPRPSPCYLAVCPGKKCVQITGCASNRVLPAALGTQHLKWGCLPCRQSCLLGRRMQETINPSSHCKLRT